MSLVFGAEMDFDDIDAAAPARRPAPRNSHRWARLISGWRDFSGRSAARRVAVPLTGEAKAIHAAFGRVSDLVGLTEAERLILVGARRDLSAVILALETLGVALDLLEKNPGAAAAWLRADNPEAPFHRRSPLQAMAQDGHLGVEITLLYLRAAARAKTV